jgi:hypothetical protein
MMWFDGRFIELIHLHDSVNDLFSQVQAQKIRNEDLRQQTPTLRHDSDTFGNFDC